MSEGAAGDISMSRPVQLVLFKLRCVISVRQSRIKSEKSQRGVKRLRWFKYFCWPTRTRLQPCHNINDRLCETDDFSSHLQLLLRFSLVGVQVEFERLSLTCRKWNPEINFHKVVVPCSSSQVTFVTFYTTSPDVLLCCCNIYCSH